MYIHCIYIKCAHAAGIRNTVQKKLQHNRLLRNETLFNLIIPGNIHTFLRFFFSKVQKKFN